MGWVRLVAVFAIGFFRKYLGGGQQWLYFLWPVFHSGFVFSSGQAAAGAFRLNPRG
jgi:hypothetical protein